MGERRPGRPEDAGSSPASPTGLQDRRWEVSGMVLMGSSLVDRAPAIGGRRHRFDACLAYLFEGPEVGCFRNGFDGE